MNRTFTDDDLLTWEAFATGGRYGLAWRPKVVFHCLTDRAVRPRFVVLSGDEADAEEAVHELPEAELRELFRRSEPLE